MSSAGKGYPGQAGTGSGNTRSSAMLFLVKQMLRLVQTATIVQVKAVKGGGLDYPAEVNVLPLVNLQDGIGTISKHGIVNGLPCWRLQGGDNSIICDPVINDIGIAIFASRDISSVKNNKAQSNPGSRRIFSWADGMYLGGILNAAPVQYVWFKSDGIQLVDKNGNTITLNATGMDLVDKNTNEIKTDSGGIHINGVLFARDQSITNAKNITTQSSIDLNTHVHTGVTTGGGNTGGPTG